MWLNFRSVDCHMLTCSLSSDLKTKFTLPATLTASCVLKFPTRTLNQSCLTPSVLQWSMDDVVSSTQIVCAWWMEPVPKGIQKSLVKLQSRILMDTPPIGGMIMGKQSSLDSVLVGNFRTHNAVSVARSVNFVFRSLDKEHVSMWQSTLLKFSHT